MKKSLLLLVALFVVTYSFGQVELKPTIGFNITSASKNPLDGDASSQWGWQFGASFLFGNKFYFEPGIMYLQRSTEFTSSNPEFDFDFKQSGIRVPVAVGLHLLGAEETDFALRAFGGGSAFFTTSVDGGEFDKDDFESPTWGVFAGAGVDLWIIFVDLKYEWSLTNISSVSEFDVGNSRSFIANAGVRLNF